MRAPHWCGTVAVQTREAAVALGYIQKANGWRFGTALGRYMQQTCMLLHASAPHAYVRSSKSISWPLEAMTQSLGLSSNYTQVEVCVTRVHYNIVHRAKSFQSLSFTGIHVAQKIFGERGWQGGSPQAESRNFIQGRNNDPEFLGEKVQRVHVHE